MIDDGDTIKDVLMQRIFARVSIKDADLKGVTDSVLLAKWNDKNIIAALASDDKKSVLRRFAGTRPAIATQYWKRKR